MKTSLSTQKVSGDSPQDPRVKILDFPPDSIFFDHTFTEAELQEVRKQSADRALGIIGPGGIIDENGWRNVM